MDDKLYLGSALIRIDGEYVGETLKDEPVTVSEEVIKKLIKTDYNEGIYEELKLNTKVDIEFTLPYTLANLTKFPNADLIIGDLIFVNQYKDLFVRIPKASMTITHNLNYKNNQYHSITISAIALEADIDGGTGGETRKLIINGNYQPEDEVYLRLDGTFPMKGALSMGGNRIMGLSEPLNITDAVSVGENGKVRTWEQIGLLDANFAGKTIKQSCVYIATKLNTGQSVIRNMDTGNSPNFINVFGLNTDVVVKISRPSSSNSVIIIDYMYTVSKIDGRRKLLGFNTTSNFMDTGNYVKSNEEDHYTKSIIDTKLLAKQPKTDSSLQTTSKTVVGGINEIKSRVDNLGNSNYKCIVHTKGTGAPNEIVDPAMPETIGTDNRHVLTNPFGINTPVIVLAEIYSSANNEWVDARFVFKANEGGYGVNASMKQGKGIIIQTGANGANRLTTRNNHSGSNSDNPDLSINTAPCRVHVWKI